MNLIWFLQDLWYEIKTRRFIQAVLVTALVVGVSAGGYYFALADGGKTGGTAVNGGASVPFRQPVALTANMQSWYKLDGDANDSTANANNGTATGITYVAGKFSRAASFNGSSSTIAGPSITPGATTESISFWFKTSTNSGYVISWGNRYCKVGGLTAHKLNCPVDGTDASSSVSANSIDDGSWHHVVLVDSSNTQTMYVDGTAQTGTTETYNNSAATLRIGSDNTPANYFTGQIDDLRLYSSALTTGNVATLYAGSNPPNCDQSCQGWWKLDESSGSLADSSGNGKTGTASGSPSYGAPGIYSSAMTFGATNNNVATAVAWPSSGSISEWVYPTTGASWISPAGWKTDPAVSTDGYILIDEGSAGTTWRAVFRPNIGGNAEQAITGPTITFNAWSHLVMTWSLVSTTYTINLYVNGAFQGTTTWTGTPGGSGVGGFNFGKSGDYNDNYFKGNIDDVRVYNRVLTSSEINEQYLAGLSQ